MAIRLRRIENTAQKQKQSVAEISHSIKQKSLLWKRVRFFSLSILLLFLVIYILLFDSSIASGVVIVKPTSVDLKTLSPGIVDWIIKPKEGFFITKGTIVARIVLHVPEILEEKKRLHQKYLELENFKINELSMKKELGKELSLLKQQELDLKLKRELSKNDLKKGLLETESAFNVYNLRKTDWEKAERLWNLDAITKTNYLTAKRLFIESETLHKNMLLQEKNLNLKNKINKDNLSAFIRNKIKNEHKYNLKLDKVATQKDLVYEEIARILQLIKGKTTHVSVPAPIDGFVFENYVRKGDFVKPGEPLLSINPKSLELFAYIREGDKAKINSDLTAKVRIGDHIFSAYIKNIKPQVISPPPQLKTRGLVSANIYYFTIELSTHEMPKGIFAGQTGLVFFNE